MTGQSINYVILKGRYCRANKGTNEAQLLYDNNNNNNKYNIINIIIVL